METCYRDIRCLEPWNDPFGGLGCGAVGYQHCRFCGFGHFLEGGVACPDAVIAPEEDAALTDINVLIAESNMEMIVAVVSVLILVFALSFYCYRRRQQKKARAAEAAAKEEALSAQKMALAEEEKAWQTRRKETNISGKPAVFEWRQVAVNSAFKEGPFGKLYVGTLQYNRRQSAQRKAWDEQAQQELALLQGKVVSTDDEAANGSPLKLKKLESQESDLGSLAKPGGGEEAAKRREDTQGTGWSLQIGDAHGDWAETAPLMPVKIHSRRLPTSITRQTTPQAIATQAEVLAKLHSEHLTKFLGIATDGERLIAEVYEREGRYFSLARLLEKSSETADAAKALRGVWIPIVGGCAKGIAYLHQHGVCHRALHPGNVLLDAAHNVKLCDFGRLAELMEPLTFDVSKDDLLPSGEPRWVYLPPELMRRGKQRRKELKVRKESPISHRGPVDTNRDVEPMKLPRPGKFDSGDLRATSAIHSEHDVEPETPGSPWVGEDTHRGASTQRPHRVGLTMDAVWQTPIDLWALGCLIARVVSMKPLYAGTKHTTKAIVNGELGPSTNLEHEEVSIDRRTGERTTKQKLDVEPAIILLVEQCSAYKPDDRLSAKELAEAIDLYKHAHSKATRRGKRELRTDKAKGLHGASTGAAAMMSMPGAHALPRPEGVQTTPTSRDKMRSLSKRGDDTDTGGKGALGAPHDLPPGMPMPHHLPPAAARLAALKAEASKSKLGSAHALPTPKSGVRYQVAVAKHEMIMRETIANNSMLRKVVKEGSRIRVLTTKMADDGAKRALVTHDPPKTDKKGKVEGWVTWSQRGIDEEFIELLPESEQPDDTATALADGDDDDTGAAPTPAPAPSSRAKPKVKKLKDVSSTDLMDGFDDSYDFGAGGRLRSAAAAAVPPLPDPTPSQRNKRADMDDFGAFDNQLSVDKPTSARKLGIIPADALKTARPLHGEARKEAAAEGQEQLFMALPPGHKFGAPAFYSSPDPSALPVPNLPIGKDVIPAAELTTARPLHGEAKREAKARGEEQVFLALPPGLGKTPPKPKPILLAKAGLATVPEDASSKPTLKPKRSRILEPATIDDTAADVDVSAAFKELDQAFGALADDEPEKKLDSSAKRLTHADMMADNILSSSPAEPLPPWRGGRRQMSPSPVGQREAVVLGGEPGATERRQRRTTIAKPSLATENVGVSSERKMPQSPQASDRRTSWQRQTGEASSRQPTETDRSLGAPTLRKNTDRVRI